MTLTGLTVNPYTSDWFEHAGAGLDSSGQQLLEKAVATVQEPLAGLFASTGEPLLDHSAGATLILAQMGADAPTRASALLGVLPETAKTSEKPDRGSATLDTTAVPSLDDLQKRFGVEIVDLVRGTRVLLDLTRRRAKKSEGAGGDDDSSDVDQKEMLRKMLLAMAADLRIVLIRLASRLQSLRWYAQSKQPCPEALARETMELYTPLANRLGIWQIKWEMEDLAFRFLQPDTYRSIARLLEERRAERETFIALVVERLENALAEEGIKATVSGRPKHIYSIWNKMRLKGLEFHQLYDLRALRVIAADERACYSALAIIHALWTPLPEEFDDYISRPKPNGYRSLHTVVADEQGRAFEVQIRTHEMHVFAEYGMAAHWRYKEAGRRGGVERASGAYDQKIAWMRQLLAWGESQPAPTETVARPTTSKSERIYVMTPQAKVIELPEGATPIDFAYSLHTDLGHRCRGARIDGQIVPLATPLQTGQTVEIKAAKSGGPSRDWLNPQLGYLASPRSRAKVRAWFNAIELQQRIAQGQGLVEKELQRLGKTAVNLEHLAEQLGFAQAEDLYVAVAKDEFSLRQLKQALETPSPDEASSANDEAILLSSSPRADSVQKTGRSGVLVVGVDALLTQLARCCRPAPPDPIAGFVTRGRGVSIHRTECPSYAALLKRHPERAIEVDWGDTGNALYPVSISIHASERANLLRDLSDVFGRLRLNIVNIHTQSRRSLARMVFTIEVSHGDEITRVLSALNELPGVSASRQ